MRIAVCLFGIFAAGVAMGQTQQAMVAKPAVPGMTADLQQKYWALPTTTTAAQAQSEAIPGMSPELQAKADALKAYLASLPTRYEQSEAQRKMTDSYTPKHHISVTAAPTNFPHQAKGMSYQEIDTNHTGIITLQDYKAAHIKGVKIRFALIDTNHDGKISPEEWRAAQLRQDVRHARNADKTDLAMPTFESLDTNKDGFISETEFWVGSTMAGLYKFDELQ